jgi:predicted flap endonuclease-1-like 5' DNA nuclease
MDDNDFVMVQYTPLQRGSHGVVGVTPFSSRVVERMKLTAGGWIFDYGHRSQGDTFLVHKADAQIMPNKFRTVASPEAQRVVRIPHKVPTPTPVPQPVTLTQTVRPTPPSMPDLSPKEFAEAKAIQEAKERAAAPFDLQTIPGVSASIARALTAAGYTTPKTIIANADSLTNISGIGPTKAALILSRAKDMSAIAQTEPPEAEMDSVMAELKKVLAE